MIGIFISRKTVAPFPQIQPVVVLPSFLQYVSSVAPPFPTPLHSQRPSSVSTAIQNFINQPQTIASPYGIRVHHTRKYHAKIIGSGSS
jgi:hypothetical protein